MAFWRTLRCWIPLRNALPADNRISVFSEITPDPNHPHSGSGHCANAGSATAGGDRFWRRLGNGRGPKAIVWFSQQSGINIENLRGDPDHQPAPARK
ncbi:propanediol utilization propanol dehydrogenase pduQ [Salmonella enterica subsp. enterica]|uniref:Propanediol utilization propanol dehydrogenase pduQ n=1 Tax=Salmonella enterica I TaxID=59201 RepID=A0A447U0P7_SALET|nr:propanediol utilization propanol dehydrogenase pduQ [Salmonella enterica subsp. enterica]